MAMITGIGIGIWQEEWHTENKFIDKWYANYSRAEFGHKI